MHVNRGLLGWGVFFIALGAVPLAVQSGALDATTARQAWQLWPMLLIGGGLGLALRQTPGAAIGNIVVGLTFGLMAGGVVGGGFGPNAPFAFCGVPGTTPSAQNGQPVTGSLGSQATVSLTVDCGAIAVSSAPGSGWSIAWPTEGVSAPDIGSPGDARLDARFGQRHGFGIGDPAAHWDVVLPRDSATNLSIEVGAGSAHASLSGAHVTSLAATVNAGDARLDLGAAIGTNSVTGTVNAGSLRVALPEPSGTLTGSFTANAGSVSICTPSSVPLRISVDGQTLGSTNFTQQGLVQDGSTWTRGPWAIASSRLDLRVTVNLGSITLDPEDGCG